MQLPPFVDRSKAAGRLDSFVHSRSLLATVSSLSPDGVVGRLARLPLRLVPRNAVVPILSGHLRGRKWIVGSGNHSCWLGTYEYDKQQSISRTVRPGSVFYDIGANVGFYSLLASDLVRGGKVYALEPLPRNLRYLRRHLELNRLSNVEVIPAAASDLVGTARFREEETGYMGQFSADGEQSVATTTLDSLIYEQGIAPPDYIKMDIEGAELKALQGASRLFVQCHPTLFLATHGEEVHRECCALLASWGYCLNPLNGLSLRDATELVANKQVGQGDATTRT